MYSFIIILMMLLAALLIVAVLLQSSKSDGLGSPLGSMGGNQLIGVKKTVNILEQITWGLAISLILLALTTSFFLKKKQGYERHSANINKAKEQVTMDHSDFKQNPENHDKN
jgi:preprotein translocase subunit SecG